MRTRDLEDAAGIAQALEQQRMPVAQAAPGIAQAAGGQMGGGMNPDFVNYLQSIAQGQAPDFQKIYEAKQMMSQVPERKGEEFNLKNLFQYISDATAQAAKANAENPRGGLGSAFAAGSRGAYEQRENKHNQKYAGQKDIMSDLLKTAEEHRKYELEKQKLEAASTRDKFNPVTGELIRFENGRAVGGVGGGGGAAANPRIGQGSVAYNQGMPNPVNSGFGATPKGQSEAFGTDLDIHKESQKELRAILSQATENSVKSADTLSSLHQMEKTLPNFYQGTGSETTHKLLKPFLSEKENKAYEKFMSKANALVLEMSQSEKGQQSNQDMERISGTKPGANNTEEGNRSILKSLEAMNLRKQQYSKAMKKFVDNGGNVNDFKNRWAEYANAFPVTSEDDNGNVTVNGENINNWEMILDPQFENIIGAYQPIFQEQPQASRMQNSQQQNNPYSSMPLEERKRLWKEQTGEEWSGK